MGIPSAFKKARSGSSTPIDRKRSIPFLSLISTRLRLVELRRRWRVAKINVVHNKVVMELPHSEATALLKNTLPLPCQTSNPIILNSALLPTESTKAILSLFK